MPTMLEMNAFDTICHEHLEYYSLAVIECVLADAGLEIVRADLNDVNGGSIRFFAGHAGGSQAADAAEALRGLRDRESELELDTAAPYEAFAQRIQKFRDDLLALLRSLRAEEKTIHMYGASTKGNTIAAVHRHRRLANRLRRRPEPGQVGVGDDRNAHPDRFRAGVARDEAGLLPRPAVALPRRVRRA